jgi:hypothetical protein
MMPETPIDWRRNTTLEEGGGRREEAQSLLEVALVLPILLLLLVIVVDAARAFDAYIVLTNAAREGARHATVIPDPTIDDIKELVVLDVVGSGTNVTNMADFVASDVDVIMGTSAVTVTVSYEFDLWFGGLVGFSTFDLSKTAVMPMYYPEP